MTSRKGSVTLSKSSLLEVFSIMYREILTFGHRNNQDVSDIVDKLRHAEDCLRDFLQTDTVLISWSDDDKSMTLYDRYIMSNGYTLEFKDEKIYNKFLHLSELRSLYRDQEKETLHKNVFIGLPVVERIGNRLVVHYA